MRDCLAGDRIIRESASEFCEGLERFNIPIGDVFEAETGVESGFSCAGGIAGCHLTKEGHGPDPLALQVQTDRLLPHSLC